MNNFHITKVITQQILEAILGRENSLLYIEWKIQHNLKREKPEKIKENWKTFSPIFKNYYFPKSFITYGM